MSPPLIKKLNISGIRTLQDVCIELSGLCVVIGENGTGKSSVVEGFELLRRLTSKNFLNEVNTIHGGESLLLRQGAANIGLKAEIASDDWLAEYEIEFNGRVGVLRESLCLSNLDGTERTQSFQRTAPNLAVFTNPGNSPARVSAHPHIPIIGLNGIAHPDPRVGRVSAAIQNVDVQLPFQTGAIWASKSQGKPDSPMRDAVTVAHTDRLDRFGSNLANAYFALRSGSFERWNYVIEVVRQGIGRWVDDINIKADAGGGRIALWVRIKNTDVEIPASSLSDGQLAYLAFVAISQMPTKRSVLVFDELETHLHPRLLTQVIALFRKMGEKVPILLTTHSRRLLDELDNPADSIRVLELDPTNMETTVFRLDEGTLAMWLEEYDGFGTLLDAGYRESFLLKERVKDE